MKKFNPTQEEKQLIEVIKSARVIQEFLWGNINDTCGLEEFKRMFRKRVFKIDDVYTTNPHWKVELRKRLLQTAALAVNTIYKIDADILDYDGISKLGIETNLPQFEKKIDEIK